MDPSGMGSRKTVSPGFSPVAVIHGFGRDTTYVDPPVSCNFLPSIGTPLRLPNIYRVYIIFYIDFVWH